MEPDRKYPVYLALRAVFAIVLSTVMGMSCAAPVPTDDRPQAVLHSELIELKISCGKNEFKMGDEIPVTFIIKNISGKPFKFYHRTYDRSGRMDEYMVIARNRSGEYLPDPREGGGGFCGGACQEKELAAGDSYHMTVTLNEWVLIGKPGVYTIEGMLELYSFLSGGFEDLSKLKSKPIEIRILKRTSQEMKAHINALAEELNAVTDRVNALAEEDQAIADRELQEKLVRQLAFTRDKQAVSHLLKAYRTIPGGDFWIRMGFSYYLPQDQATTRKLLATVFKKGLAWGMFYTLEDRGCPRADLIELLRESLNSDDAEVMKAATFAASSLAEPALLPGLVRIARNPDLHYRGQALHGLKWYKTPEALKALQALTEDPDTKIRDEAREILRELQKAESSE